RDGNGRVAGRLGCGEAHVVVVSFRNQKVEQRSAAFLVSVSQRFADLFRFGSNIVAITLPPIQRSVIEVTSSGDISRGLGLNLEERQARLLAGRLGRKNVSPIPIPDRQWETQTKADRVWGVGWLVFVLSEGRWVGDAVGFLKAQICTSL